MQLLRTHRLYLVAQNIIIIFYSFPFYCKNPFLYKVSKFQKQIFLFSFEPKTEWNYFLNSALPLKWVKSKKMKALYYINIPPSIWYNKSIDFFYLTQFRPKK